MYARSGGRIMMTMHSVFNNDLGGVGTDAGIRSQQLTPLGAIYSEISDVISRVSDHVNTHPDVESDVIQDFNSQLTAMVEGINAVGQAYQQLDYAKENLEWKLKALSREEDAAGWVGGQDNGNRSIPVTNSFGRVVGTFAEL